MVCSGSTGHAEAVEVYYDPKVIDYATLLKVFFGSQDATQVNGQGPDRGTQYRSVIFYGNTTEKAIAEKAIAELNAKGNGPIATQVVPFEKFWKAEDYHQGYEKLHPDQPYVATVSKRRYDAFRAKFPELVR
jgi:peptide-methionine (S)-S-oxide reductase